MKLYIRCMSQNKRDMWSRLDDKAGPLVEHLIKIIVFQENGNLKHWCDELGGFINKVPTFKHNNKLPDSKFIYQSIWGNESRWLDVTVDNVIATNSYDPLITDISIIRNFCEEYIQWLSETLSKQGKVFVNNCRDRALELMNEVGG